jgi:pyruvate/2-oxoglutarate/acetoin dehydrogenase E1 component
MFKNKLNFSQTISETIYQNMKKNKNIIVSGLEVNYSSKVFGTLDKPYKKFSKRFLQTPAMESGLCAILSGAAINGMKPLFVTNRCDFLLYAFDIIVNVIDKWKYMYDGKQGNCPIIISAVIGRGWGQGPTHSQSFHNFFSRLTGIDVFLPTFPSDIIGTYNYAFKSNRPSIILLHRSLFNLKEVEKKIWKFGKARIVNKGSDILIISNSFTTIQSLRAVKEIESKFNKKITILDITTTNPLDEKTILKHAKTHNNIILIDIDHVKFGILSEIHSLISSKYPKKKVIKIGNKFTPTPVSANLEDEFYPSDNQIFKKCCKLLNIKSLKSIKNQKLNFDGPY